jgi:glyoxylase-like metal-dependent hydrolase (beta-lactamase superfamily II)
MVVAAPGHTDDSVTMYNPSTQTLLSGDAVLTVGGRAWHTPEVVDAATASSSALLLQRLPVAHLLPGHGLPAHADSVWEHQRHR